MKRIRFVVSAVTLLLLTGFVPGSSTSVVNACSGTVRVVYQTAAHPEPISVLLRRGRSLEASGDYSVITLLSVTFPTGRNEKLSSNDLNQLKSNSKLARGVWWIDDRGIGYISMRDANVRKRRLFGRL
jgi:hypothetical protein